MPDLTTTTPAPTVNVQAPTTGKAGIVGGAAATGASTGAYIGSVVPGIGTAIGAAVGAAVGTVAGLLGVAKGKTAHLDFSTASNVAQTMVVQIDQPIRDLFGFKSVTYNAYGRAIAAEALKLVQARLNSGSKSWQSWIGNAIADLSDRANSPTAESGSVLYVYIIYVGMNYDASRPEEFGAVLVNDITLMMQALTGRFPETVSIVQGVASAAGSSAAGVPVKASSNILGIDGATGSVRQQTTAAATGGAMAPADQGKMVLYAGFGILIAGLLFFTRKK